MDPTIQKQLEDANSRLAALKAVAEKAREPITSNFTPPPTASEPTGTIDVRPVYEVTDHLKGKGLAFASAARCLAQAKGNAQEAMRLAAVVPWGKAAQSMITKSLGESTLSGGGALVPDPLAQEFIELLRPNVVMLNAGITRIPMTTAALTFARQSGAATATWLGESQNITSSQQTFDNVQLQLKKLGCQTPIANDLLRDNAIAADMIVRQDLLAVAQRELDVKILRGLGTAYAPRGILNTVAAANLFNSGGAGTPTITTVLSDLWTAIRLVRAANVPVTAQNAFWVFSPRSEAGLSQFRDGVGRPFFAQEMATGKLLGFRYFTTTQIPENLTGHGSGGSTESECYFVVGDQCLLGEGLAPTIQVVPQGAYYDGSVTQSGLSRDETVVTVLLRADFAMRHNLAASVVQGVVWQ